MSDQTRLPTKHTRRLRRASTSTELTLWDAIRNRQVKGLKFRRQHPIVGTVYVVDFCCLERRLVIEIDGAIHKEQIEADRQRQRDIEGAGYTVMRFSATQVETQLPDVLRQIVVWVAEGS